MRNGISCRWSGIVWLSAAIFWSGTVLAGPVTQIQSLDFSTIDQSLWAPGSVATTGKTFTHTFINLNIPQNTIGKITGTITVPNPLRTAYDLAVAACSGFQPCIDLLGDPPSATISVPQKNGAAVTYSGGLSFGVSGGISLDSGKVNAGYTSQAKISVDSSGATPGQHVTIHTSESNNSTSLSSQFAGLNANLATTLGIKAKASVEAYLAGAGGTVPLLNVNNTTTKNLVTVDLHGPTATVDFPILGTPPLSVGVGIEQNIPIPLDPADPAVGIPFISHSLQLPQLDSSHLVSGGSITNTIEPISRLCAALVSCPPNPTDYEKLSINLAALGLLDGVPLGATVGIPLVVSAEADIVKADFSLIGEFSQKLNFTPNLTVTLNFNQPTQVEVSPGIFQFVTSETVPIGQDINLIQPDSNLVIDPVYSLADNSFSNDTEWLLQFLQSLNFLEFKLSGPAASLLGASFDVSAIATSLPLGSPLDLGPLSDTSPFSLQGFQDISGTPFTLAALLPVNGGSSVPEPSTLYLVGAGLLALTAVRRRQVARVAAS